MLLRTAPPTWPSITGANPVVAMPRKLLPWGKKGITDCFHFLMTAAAIDWPFSTCIWVCVCMRVMHSTHAA